MVHGQRGVQAETGHQPRGGSRPLPSREQPGRRPCGIRQAHLLADHLHRAQATAQQEQHGRQQRGELGRDTAALRVTPP